MEISHKATSFLELPPNLGLSVFPCVIKNSERHYNVARVLSDVGEYPNAIAHLILGTEELIKALVLFLEGKGIGLRTINGYKRLFYDHKARHAILKDFFSMWVGISGMLEIKSKPKYENTLMYYVKSALVILKSTLAGIENHDWWNNADNLKQVCFYVDYNTKITGPDSLVQEDYLKADYHVQKFRKEIRGLIADLSRASKKEIEEFDKLLEEADFRDLISETLKRSSKKSLS